MVTWGKPALHQSDDPYIAGLLTTKRQWERRQEVAAADKFWNRFCVVIAVLAIAAFVSTLAK